jgi:hypothetical protein
MTPLRIGVWFQTNHTPYGGPSLVLTGTILGLYKNAEETGQPIVVLLNEQGDVNWALAHTASSESDAVKMPDLWYGPLLFNHADADCEDYKNHRTWKLCKNVLFPSDWFRAWINTGFPYLDPPKAGDRQTAVWPSGVNTDFFSPSEGAKEAKEKTQDYFIYFKSQSYEDLKTVQGYLFENWFGLTGTVVTYYHYDPAMLRAQARASKFCILLDATETQGLAPLEILACGCPLFILDATTFVGSQKMLTGATSATCWDTCCGIKSSLKTLDRDFPIFLSRLSTFNPAPWVVANYSYAVAGRRLLSLITGKQHKAQNHKEEDRGVKEESEGSRTPPHGSDLAQNASK